MTKKLEIIDYSFQLTKNGKIMVYSGTKDVTICSYNFRGKSSTSCTWSMPIVTIEYQQGVATSSDQIIAISKSNS